MLKSDKISMIKQRRVNYNLKGKKNRKNHVN